MSSSTNRSDAGNSSESAGRGGGGGGGGNTQEGADMTMEVEAGATMEDEGECSDSDALLPAAKKQQSPSQQQQQQQEPSNKSSHCAGITKSTTRAGRKGKEEMGLFGEEGDACSPLLLGASSPSPCDTDIPSLTHAMSPSATTDDDSASSSNQSHCKTSTSTTAIGSQHHDTTTTYGDSHMQVPSRKRSSSDDFDYYAPGRSSFSTQRERHRSPSPRPPLQPQDTQQSSPILLRNRSPLESAAIYRNHSPIQHVVHSTNQQQQEQQYSQEQISYVATTTDEVEGFLPASILNNPPFLHHHPPHHNNSATPSVTSSQSNSSSSGLGGIRRFVRSRAVTNRTRTTAESSSSQLSTQSLGDEDLFALTINGEDPRLSSSSSIITPPPPPPTQQQHQQPPSPPPALPLPLPAQPSQRALWDAARIHSSEHFPPIVWEESASDSDDNHHFARGGGGGGGGERGGGRRRTFSEPSGNRIRGFLFPTPGVRRRAGSRQSRSVRRHLPRSSSTSSANMLAAASPLSTTAAAVLFTSSQASQASMDSFQEFTLSPHNRSTRSSRQNQQQQPQQQQQPGRQQRPSPINSSNPQLRMSSLSLDDSARAGMGTTSGHRSIVMDGTVGDALSISTIGNSTMARSDPTAGGLGESGRQSSQRRGGGGGGSGGPGGDGGATQARHLREGNLETGGGQAGNGNDGSATDPDREARVRWVRINQRFQLMITFVAICFSLLLFSILISWIVLTSAYVVTFEKECDIPLKFFYWLVTLQLILDVFRNDIMRYVLQWDPAAQPPGSTAHQFIPARVVAYNIAYLAYALLVLRMGINCVYIEGRQPESTCRNTAPELFQSSVVFVTLTLAAWATIILGYLVPFCFVATLLTLNGYNPGEAEDGAIVGTSPIPGGVFPSTAYSSNAAPAGTIEQLREVDLDECGEQECSICLEDFRTGRHNADDVIVITPCGHILHKNCCSVWLRQARTCPVCRTDIPNALAERLRQEQAELADSSQDLQQQPVGEIRHPISPVHHRAPVTPHLPFRPAGRQEVATLIRAFRQPRRERRRGGGSRRASGSERSHESGRSRRSLTNQSNVSNNQIERPRSAEPSSNSIEITALNRRVDSNSTLHTSEGNRSSILPTNGGNSAGGEAQYVL